MNKNLTTEQKNILFEEGTEAPGSSPLNSEKREGYYCCVVCGTKLFESTSKYESGSGWPSFFKSRPNVFETKIDTDIMAIFLMIDQSPLEKDTVIMVYV